jgi:hypothetical protein
LCRHADAISARRRRCDGHRTLARPVGTPGFVTCRAGAGGEEWVICVATDAVSTGCPEPPPSRRTSDRARSEARRMPAHLIGSPIFLGSRDCICARTLIPYRWYNRRSAGGRRVGLTRFATRYMTSSYTSSVSGNLIYEVDARNLVQSGIGPAQAIVSSSYLGNLG